RGLARGAEPPPAFIPPLIVVLRDAVDVRALELHSTIGVKLTPQSMPLVRTVRLALHKPAHADLSVGVMFFIHDDIRRQAVPAVPGQPYRREYEQRRNAFQICSSIHEAVAAAFRRSMGSTRRSPGPV